MDNFSKSLCLVTAFMDIQRGNWTAFQRSFGQYLCHFYPYTKLHHEMIIFIDDKYYESVKRLCNTNIRLIPINEQWMKEHIYAYSTLERETEIMNSSEFKKLVSHRLHHPECCKPMYNIIQHSKIDFVCHVINNKLSSADYYAWTDFGYFQDSQRIPSRELDPNKFNLDKINFQGISPLTQQDSDTIYTLTCAPERIGGFFYLDNVPNLLIYQELYHTICKEFHDTGIVDNDQHIMIKCVFRQPELFHVWNLGGWHQTYLYFQK